MRNITCCLVALFVSLAFIACSTNVRREKIPGTYVASYPFGTQKITLNPDGTLIQQVTIKNEAPATARGSWKVESHKSRVELYGSMVVVDGFGRLRSDWRTVTSGIVSTDIEMHWFKILMGSASEYPYVKQ